MMFLGQTHLPAISGILLPALPVPVPEVPMVINAALTLAARPQSKVAQDNMDVFKDQWEKQVRILTEAVDDITSVDDFLSVSENHILEDVNKCVIALQEGDVDTLDRTAGAIRGRAARVVHIINAEMENYEPGVYTERVLESIKLLSETAFTVHCQFVDISNLVCDGHHGEPQTCRRHREHGDFTPAVDSVP
ncbi:catenin alpha-2 isoform X1 [Tachysurus ichikawai]